MVDVFSACAEMFLLSMSKWMKAIGFLCVCRDVSRRVHCRTFLKAFSLRVQRCFLGLIDVQKHTWVFSACAEMFLTASVFSALTLRFLCVCRDVSEKKPKKGLMRMFSLRVQRCFLSVLSRRLLACVFSACAEMFLFLSTRMLDKGCFLCVCRDVS